MTSSSIPNELILLTESFKRVTKFVILKFESSDLNVKQEIIRNFIAKSHSLVNSIYLLLDEDQEGEAIALYRLLIERYFYIEYLEKTDSYQSFKDWSYVKTFESRNKSRSGSLFNDPKTKQFLADNKEQVKKYQELKKKRILGLNQNLKHLLKKLTYHFYIVWAMI